MWLKSGSVRSVATVGQWKEYGYSQGSVRSVATVRTVCEECGYCQAVCEECGYSQAVCEECRYSQDSV